MRVGIVGFGYMGRSRMAAVQALAAGGADIGVAGVVDPELVKPAGTTVPGPAGIPVFGELDPLLLLAPDLVIVAAPHRVAVDSCLRALATGAQVLIEKPLGRNLAEAQQLAASQVRPGQLHVGLNYRFFDGIGALLGDVRRGRFGTLVSASLVLGHGHQPGMERNWKLDPAEAGSGVLLDPGIDLLDLARLLAGDDLRPVCCLGYRGFWRTGVVEEAHVLLEAGALPVVSVQLSAVRWRSTFRIEVSGTDGYGVVEGRGRSYGHQTYRVGRRWAWSCGRPQRDTETLECQTDGTAVFERELQALLAGGQGGPLPPSSAESALLTMRLVDACERAVRIGGEPDATTLTSAFPDA